MHNKMKVPVTTSQEMIKDIRMLALSGKSLFSKYLHGPLEKAGWHADVSSVSRRKIMERIKKDSPDQAYLHTIAPRCKKLICSTMDDSLAALGESSIFFLEMMQIHSAISSCSEAIEFAEILMQPLSEFRKADSERSIELFTEAMSDAEADDLKTAFEPVKLVSDTEKIKLDNEIQRLYENIKIASQYHNIPKCRKILSSYIIRYSDADDYAGNDVEKLVKALNNREPGFEDELKSTISIDLYYRIRQGVLKGDIKTTITAIRKYGYIFEGSPDSKFFYDIDRLERILYNMISEKGLWDELKDKRK